MPVKPVRGREAPMCPCLQFFTWSLNLFKVKSKAKLVGNSDAHLGSLVVAIPLIKKGYRSETNIAFFKGHAKNIAFLAVTYAKKCKFFFLLKITKCLECSEKKVYAKVFCEVFQGYPLKPFLQYFLKYWNFLKYFFLFKTHPFQVFLVSKTYNK